MPQNGFRVDVSVWTIAKIILVLTGFYLLFFIRDILALLFIVLILVAAFDPIINKWEKKLHRGPAVVLLFVIILLVLAAIIYVIVPPVISQLSQLINQLPDIAQRFRDAEKYVPAIEKNLSSISQYLTDITGGFVSITAGVFGGVFSLLTAFVITAYMLLDKNAFSQFAISIMPNSNRRHIIVLLKKIGQKLGGWFRGQILLGIIIGTCDLIGLLIIGVPYALILAIISGLLEIIPTIGPIVAGIIAVIVAYTADPIKAVFAVVLYIIVQQLENNFIVPKLMQKAVGLSPVIIIFSILIGAKLLGIIGAILAVPLAASISVIAQEWPNLTAENATETSNPEKTVL